MNVLSDVNFTSVALCHHHVSAGKHSGQDKTSQDVKKKLPIIKARGNGREPFQS